ncbi:MAG: thioredoxin family protein [Anaerolineae bacterium]
MITITVIGTTPPCIKCKRAEVEAQKAADAFPGQVVMRKIDALSAEAEAYGMFVTPAVAVGDRLVASGKILPCDQIVPHIKNLLGG